MKYKANSYHFIVSIDDEKNIRAIYDDIIVRRCEQRGFKSQYHSITTPTELINILSQIENETKNENSYPHIHFEAHGNDMGIKLNHEIRLSWEDLSNQLTKINGHSKNNLIVSMALCFGGLLTSQLLTSLYDVGKSRAPAFAVIGPDEEISSGELEDGFTHFFDILLTDLDLTKAVEELTIFSNYSGHFNFQSCESIFKLVVENYISYNVNEFLKSPLMVNYRVHSLLKPYEYIKKRKINQEEFELAKKKISKQDLYRQIIEEMRTSYFWIDLYPENDKRFPKVDWDKWDKMIKDVQT